MTADQAAEVRAIARLLSEIAHALAAPDDPEQRVRRVLELLADLLPYRRCAILRSARADAAPNVVCVPEPPPAALATLTTELTRIHRLIAEADEIGRASNGAGNLTLPLLGFDDIVGVIRVEPHADAAPYDARHLRLLSVVAAQLGSYLSMIELREREARKAADLAAAHEFQQRLIGIVSHDLRNPLHVISLVAEQLRGELEDPRHVSALQRALRNARNATRILNDLLDVTSVRVTGSLAMTVQTTDLAALVSSVVDDLRVAHPGVTLSTTIEGTPRGSFDPQRLTQLLGNLVNNAIQHGAPGRPVQIRLAQAADTAVLEVANEGRPIAPALLPSLFDPFRQGSSAAGAGSGHLGLGLYVVAQIAEAHGGHVSVRSTASAGTTFTVTLPRHPDSAAVGGGQPRVILVVDDDADIRETLAALLEIHGFPVVTACDGADAIQLLDAGLRPRLILTDLRMPGIDGAGLLRHCRTDPALQHIPVMVISADLSAHHLESAGASAVLTKPLHPAKLLERIAALSA